MTPDMKSKLRQLLIKHEDYRSYPYIDTTNNITIGVGRNLTDRGLLPVEIDLMLQHDIEFFYNFLSDKFPWFLALDEARQLALIDMCFMGTKSFMSFKRMLSALANADYEHAADEVLASKYAEQVGQRAKDIATIIRTGTL